MRRARRSRRRVFAAVALGLAATVAVDHARHGDGRAAYDHRTVTVGAVTAGDAIRLPDGTAVRLLGLCDPDPAAVPYLAGRLAGRPVTLLLPAVGWREADGRVGAYVYDGPACVNVDLVRAGLARFDRRRPTVLAGLLGPAEADARRHRRGWCGRPAAHAN